jgi:hypothetical protein
MLYAGPTPEMATTQSFSLNFNSGSPTSGLSFVLDGYRSLDGQNFYEDDFSLKLNDQQIFLGTFNLGGGSNSGSQANVYSNPFRAKLSNPTKNGTGISFSGGKEIFSFAGLPLNIGLNILTFSYASLGAGHAGFQGLGDEGWGVEQVSVSATPLPAALPLFATGLGALGLLGWRRKRKAAGKATNSAITASSWPATSMRFRINTSASNFARLLRAILASRSASTIRRCARQP